MTRHRQTSILAMIIALVVTSPLVYWTLDWRPPVDVLSYKLSATQVRAGDTLYRDITVFRHRACRTDPTVILIDGGRVRFNFEEPATDAPGPIGIVDTYRQSIVIPLQAAPGKAELRVSIARSCNPIQAIWPRVTVYEPIFFEILPH